MTFEYYAKNKTYSEVNFICGYQIWLKLIEKCPPKFQDGRHEIFFFCNINIITRWFPAHHRDRLVIFTFSLQLFLNIILFVLSILVIGCCQLQRNHCSWVAEVIREFLTSLQLMAVLGFWNFLSWKPSLGIKYGVRRDHSWQRYFLSYFWCCCAKYRNDHQTANVIEFYLLCKTRLFPRIISSKP